MLPGEAVAHANFANIIHDIALLNSLGVRLVICHGARQQIEQHLLGEQSKAPIDKPLFHNGLRITDTLSLKAVKETVGLVRTEIEALLSTGLPNSPMHGAKIRVCSGNMLTAKPLGVIDGVDYLHTGKVRKVDSEAIQHFLQNGYLVLLSPLGFSLTGEVFNLSLEEVAVKTAISLKADKLIAYGSQPGVKNTGQQLIRQLSLTEAKNQSGSQQENLPAAITACEAGIERCHLISYAEDGALLEELFTRDGAGTLISPQQYENIRTATIDDVGGVLELIAPLEAKGTLVKRSRELLENEIGCFTVIERDGAVIGCAAIYPFDNAQAELACVVTHAEYRGDKRAVRLLEFIENRARAQHINKLFVLTTQTAHWFLEQGFEEKSMSELPAQKQQLYNLQRNSKIFMKLL